MSTFNEADQLLVRIERLRKRMTRVALLEGFTSPESIRISQELDELLNTYDKYKHKYNKS
ncbi:Spo0E like sporulation regulatory protein [Thalassobacillus cyri]|uniref:Spo0E like sporulation regulatory protein n=1 Tax=Thalassobacillus cyri TaxID=571932 RepID=A0A1H4GML8_9BACI|nr:aspartyl-phosphate phosphatase Spo0E family protein [Thalassobacillus cyri]SEB10757.1 Spo0E like sporulation regulatory protein [Thalassobacillus cyri]